jgi:hypothetical protein
MTTTTTQPPEARVQSSQSRLLLMPEFWGTIAIASMWVAVLLTSIYGGDLVSVNGGGYNQQTTIPTGIFVALFACLASISVARRTFRRA